MTPFEREASAAFWKLEPQADLAGRAADKVAKLLAEDPDNDEEHQELLRMVRHLAAVSGSKAFVAGALWGRRWVKQQIANQ